MESCGSNSSHASCSAGLVTALAVEDDDDVSSGAGSSSSSGQGDDLKEAHRPAHRYSQDKSRVKKVSVPKEMPKCFAREIKIFSRIFLNQRNINS
jgi:hypothetical protein